MLTHKALWLSWEGDTWDFFILFLQIQNKIELTELIELIDSEAKIMSYYCASLLS